MTTLNLYMGPFSVQGSCFDDKVITFCNYMVDLYLYIYIDLMLHRNSHEEIKSTLTAYFPRNRIHVILI